MMIGLLGGSFNPAHAGHRYISEVALKRLGLDYVWWLVSPQNPLKPAAGMAPRDTRLAAARKVANHPRLIVSDLECKLGTRYTIDTVSALQYRFPQVHFVWLIGSDNLQSLHRWKDWQAIAARLPIAVVLRTGSVLSPLTAKAATRFRHCRVTSPKNFAHRHPPALIVLDGHRNPLSATALREASKKPEALVGGGPAC